MKIHTASFITFSMLILSGCGGPSEETKDLPTPATETVIKKKTILALGDSLTEGYRVDKSESYPAQLQDLLDAKGYRYEVINSGISGETSTGLSERLNWTLSQNPDLIILTTGANDAIRGIDLSITKANIENIVETIQAKNIPLIFGGMEIYENLGSEYVTEFKNIYPTIAKQYDLPFIPFFLEGVAGNPNLNIEDQIHPNKDGYKIIVEQNIWPVLEGMLK